MTAFQRTINKETNHITYYVDGKKVTNDKFYFIHNLRERQGGQYNSSLTTSDNKYIRHYYHI